MSGHYYPPEGGGGSDPNAVIGPVSSTDNAVARFNGATGKIIQNSGVILSDTNNLTGVADLSATGTTTLAASLSGPVRATSGVISTGNTNLVSEVTGVLPVANGGTNASTALINNRIIRSTSGSIVEAAAITANRALISDASGIPTQSATTNTELGFVGGVTSGIQGQLDAKLDLAGDTMTGLLILSADPAVALGAATKQYVDANAGTIYTADGQGIEVVADEFSLELDAGTLSKSATGLKVSDLGIANAQIATMASITATKLGNGDVDNTELSRLNGVADTIVTLGAAQTLTGKTLDGDDNTVQDLALTSLKTVLADADKVLRRDASGVVISGNALPNASSILTTDGAQVVTVKDIDGGTASNTVRITIPKQTLTNLTALARKQATIVYDTTSNAVFFDNGTSLVQLVSASVVTGATNGLAPAMSTLSRIRLAGQNGYGSTNTCIKRFLNTIESVGSSITYADSATLGATFTINTSGLYSFTWSDSVISGGNSGFSRNSTNLSSNIATINQTDRLTLATSSTGDVFATNSLVMYLVATDVIRAHGDTTADTASPTRASLMAQRIL